MLQAVAGRTKLDKDDVYYVEGPVHLGDLMAVANWTTAELHDPPSGTYLPPAFRDAEESFFA